MSVSPERAKTLLWDGLRLIVLDIETVMVAPDLPVDVQSEIEAAIALVKETGEPVRLKPAAKRVRFLQHRLIEAAGLFSPSAGDEPGRAVTILPSSPDGTELSDEPKEPAAGSQHRMAAIALVECQNGKPEKAGWMTLVNPGAPVDTRTGRIHNLKTGDLQVAPMFETIAPTIIDKLTPRAGETLVLVAHTAGFDVGTVLRSEFARIKRDLPELPVLDTAGRLSALAKVAVPGASLDDLVAAVDVHIAPEDRHTALGDAMATAQAVCILLNGAAEHGFSDLTELLKRAGSRLTTDIKGSAPGTYRKKGAYVPDIPETHTAAHFLLGDRPGKDELAGWIAVADECAHLSCPELALSPASMVLTTDADPATVLGALVQVVRRRAAAADGVGTNAAVGAVAAAYGRWCPMPMPHGFTGRYPFGRRMTVKIGHEVMPLADALPRCSSTRACPWCIERRPCGRDEIVRAMAPAILDPKWVDGKLTRQTTYNAWLHAADKGGWNFHRRDPAIKLSSSHTSKGMPAGPRLADPAMALMVRSYAVYGEEPDRVARSRDALAKLFRRGCADPAIHEMWARQQASPGRVADLEAAVATAEAQLEKRPAGTTDSGWSSLALYRDHLRGRLARLRDPKRLDEDGNSITVRSHSAGSNARRQPVFRFLRG